MFSFHTISAVWGANGAPRKKEIFIFINVEASEVRLTSVCGVDRRVSKAPVESPTCRTSRYSSRKYKYH